MGYYVDISEERETWAFEHRDPIEGRYYESVVGKLGERVVLDAFPGIIETKDEDRWEWDLYSTEGQTVEVKTKLSTHSRKVHVRTRGRERDEMAELYVICGYASDRARIYLLGYLTKTDVYDYGSHLDVTDHDDTLTVDFDHLRPVEDLFRQYGRA